jgi:hypothetical protein
MKKLIVMAALALGLVSAGAAQADRWAPAGASSFVSPTRNIQCVYVNKWGIECRTANNGRVAILRAHTGAVTFRGGALAGDPWSARYSGNARVISYGSTVTYGGTLRVRSSLVSEREWPQVVHSTTAGIEVWSTLAHRGFRISRDSAWRI